MRLVVFYALGTVLLLAGSVRGQVPESSSEPPMAETPTAGRLVADPAALSLCGAQAVHGLLISETGASDEPRDVTRSARYRSADPRVATVNRWGRVTGVGNGKTIVEVHVGKQRLQVPVTVEDAERVEPFHFERDIVPILSRYGCNSSGCHGKAEGQNGFKLSVFGFDPAADYRALVAESRGRRVFPAAPERSLLLLKASGRLPHGGGVRLPESSRDYARLRDWIAGGLPLGDDAQPTVAEIQLSPGRRVLSSASRQQLRVLARRSDGRWLDVTELAQYQTNNEGLAQVDDEGLVSTGTVPGVAAVMASYAGRVTTFTIILPRDKDNDEDATVAGVERPVKETGFIDRWVHQQLRQLNIPASPPADDSAFVRRVYLDLIGKLPTADEAREFLTDRRADRRTRLVDQLLDRAEFADYWALKWSDLLRVDRQTLGHEAAYAQYQWIRDSLARRKPLDQFAKEILTAGGPLAENPQGHLYKTVARPGELAATVSQVFLGVRIECAQCHHHPFDRWSQRDYAGMQSFFAQVKRKSIAGSEVLLAEGNPATRHPRTGEPVFAYALGTTMPDAHPEGDRRKVLAEWLASADNPWFARNLANRVWADLMGRGLVEPVDDFRETNPPSHPELLEALGRRLADSGFDLRALLRTIVASETYQRSSRPLPGNISDEQNFSRSLLKSMPAEVLLDAVCDTTGVMEKFPGIPAGSRAVDLWDSQVQHDFLKMFGRPVRKSACECERQGDPSVAQVLHLLNSPRIHDKLAHAGGRVARLERSITDDQQLVEELYLNFFSRFPDDDERRAAMDYIRRAEDRKQACEDLGWSMLNSLEFIFNH